MQQLNRLSFLALTLAFMANAGAIAQDHKNKKLQKSAVGDQEVQLEYMFNIDRDCKPYGEIRFVILKPPANGTVTFRPYVVASAFKQDHQSYHCNKNKSVATAAYYVAKPGFKGTDKLKFAIVFHDGESWTYDVEMTVWGP